MWSSFEIFCEQNGLPADESRLHLNTLPIWKQVFETHISKDILLKERDKVELLNRYYQLSKEYFNGFLLHVHDDLIEPIPEWEHDNAIHYAAKHGYHYFLEQNYKEYCQAHPDMPIDAIDFSNKYSMRPLHLAASKGHLQTVAILLELGANPNLENQNQELPIECAAKTPIRCSAELKAQKESIVTLLKNAAPGTLRHTNLQNESIVHILAACGYTSLLESIIREDKTLLRLADNGQRRPIHHAILNNRLETVNSLLELAGDDQESLVGFEGHLPIHSAALRGTEEMVKLCCKLRPQDINKLDYLNRSALDIARMEGNTEAISILSKYSPTDKIHVKQSLEK